MGWASHRADVSLHKIGEINGCTVYRVGNKQLRIVMSADKQTQIVFSYAVPVAMWSEGKLAQITSYDVTPTTRTHINVWRRLDSSGGWRECEYVSQESLDVAAQEMVGHPRIWYWEIVRD
jgi:hypothetical protein